MRFPVKYYNNWAALPMIISLVGSLFFFGLALKENNGVCTIIAMILFVVFVILKILNIAIASK